MRHDYKSSQVFLLLRRHGVPVRVALRILAELAPTDPLDRLEQHEKGVVFKAAVAHYLRLCGREHTDPAERVMVRWDIQRLAWIVTR
jgi:hypothetical protein